MQVEIEVLKQRDIISFRNVEDLRKYIQAKYPEYDSKKASVVLADAIHKIIDKNIDVFKEEHRSMIRTNLVKKAVSKGSFCISAWEVFDECASMNYSPETYMEELLCWLGKKYDINTERSIIYNYIHELRHNESLSVNNEPLYSAENKPELVFHSHDDHRELIVKIRWKLKEHFIEWLKSVFEAAAVFLGSALKYIDNARHRLNINYKVISLALIFIIIFGGFFLNIHGIREKISNEINIIANVNRNNDSTTVLDEGNTFDIVKRESGLSSEFKYMTVNQNSLREWLKGRNSILANEPYFSAIMGSAKKYNVNPLLMFAITGQEQSFVPKSQENAQRIANNPFNVYGSWLDYNTNIFDSSEIAAKTIINLSRNRPSNVHEIQWLNRKYAEDDSWWLGVTRIYTNMKEEILEIKE